MTTGAGLPVTPAENVTVWPQVPGALLTVILAGQVRIGAELTVNVATLEVALPEPLEKTARNWWPFWEAAPVKFNGLEVAPGMLVKAPPLLACH